MSEPYNPPLPKTASQLHPAFILIDYVWALLKRNAPEIWNEANYDGLVPIVPLADQPELAEFSGPRIIYEFSSRASGNDFYRKKGSTTFAIIADSQRKLTRTINILETAFERQDESAADVDAFAATNSPPTNTATRGGIGFTSIRLQLGDSGSPTESEGGPVLGVVSIQWEAVVDFDITTRL